MLCYIQSIEYRGQQGAHVQDIKKGQINSLKSLKSAKAH